MSLNKKQIYIVDDDESVCRALKSLLMTFDFEVVTFNSAKVFLETVPINAPGCLVLDIHMPQMDGWETQKRVVASGSKRPVIFMSASKDNVADQALKAGAIGFLQKPFDCQTLVDLIYANAEKNNRSTIVP